MKDLGVRIHGDEMGYLNYHKWLMAESLACIVAAIATIFLLFKTMEYQDYSLLFLMFAVLWVFATSFLTLLNGPEGVN